MKGLLKRVLDSNLGITEKGRKEKMSYLPKTITCTLSKTGCVRRLFLRKDTRIVYRNSSSLVTGILKVSVDGRLAL